MSENQNSPQPIKTKKRRSTAIKKKNLNKTFSTCFVVFNLLIVAVILFISMRGGKDGNASLFAHKISWQYLVVAVLFIYIAFLFESARIQVLMYKCCKKFEPMLCLKAAMLGRYYDLITPLNVGGKPYQIYYFYSRGLKSTEATSVSMTDYLAQKLGFSFFSIVILALFFGYLKQFNGDTAFMGIVIAGFTVNLLLSVGIVFVSVNKKLTDKAVHGLISLLCRMRIFKNKEKALEKVNKTLDDYRTAFRNLIKKPRLVIVCFVLTVFMYLSFACVVFFLYCSFFGFTPSQFGIIILAVVLFDYIVGIVPLPGGTGAVELSFVTMFSSLFIGGRVYTAVLLWKSLTYILPILNGFAVFAYDSIWGNKKNKARIAAASARKTKDKEKTI